MEIVDKALSCFHYTEYTVPVRFSKKIQKWLNLCSTVYHIQNVHLISLNASCNSYSKLNTSAPTITAGESGATEIR